MHPALYKLIGMQARAVARRMVRGGRSPGRIVVFILGAILCGAWLIGAGINIRKNRVDPVRVRAVMPIALLGICILTAVTSAGDKAIAFTPGEVDLLFPGPFTRRELLAYKLIKSTGAAVLTAAVLSVVMLKYARWWPACFVGVFLSLLLVQFVSIALLLAGQALGAAAFSRVRRWIVIGAAVLLIVGMRSWISMGAGAGEGWVYQFHDSPAGRFALSSFEPYGRIMTADRIADVLKWGVLATLENLGLVVIVILLDAHYVETAMAASERRYAKIQRVRAGAFLSVGLSKTARWHLPMLGWMGGAGPIAWRQLTTAARSSRGLMLLLVLVAFIAAPALKLAGQSGHVFGPLLGVLGWLTFLCSSMLNFDFRGDVDHIESLKALPLRESSVAVGQLVAPVLVLSAFHVLFLGVAAVFVPVNRAWILMALALCFPFNAILFSAENLIFLLFPSRPAAVSPGDFQVLGRKFIFVLVKMLILSVTGSIALFAAIFVWVMTGKNYNAATSVAWVILAMEVAALVPILAWAYRRFDPSVHIPT